jgi:predicted ATPase/class 3 adenylate cyclase
LTRDPALDAAAKSSTPELPAGTVTFLMTDIEGSTRLWEKDSASMQQALARHDNLASKHVREARGQLVEAGREGDSILAVFERATDALGCALRLQTAFAGEAWPAGAELRVRIALHSGEANLRGGHYYGTAVYRCARLLAVGHGGQILVSQATEQLGRDLLPQGAHLEELGWHRLKDLVRPEQLYQLSHADLRADFPALRSLDSRPHNLPTQTTSFVGRDEELVAVAKLLRTCRLLTITGAGGSGKTRLALHAAAEFLASCQDGVWFVDLATVRERELLVPAIASVLRLREQPDRPLVETVRHHLRDRVVLLLLDNCEHIVDECAAVSELILSSCAGATVLATSREALRTGAETAWTIPTLTVPDPREEVSCERLTRYAAAKLFLERASQVDPRFELTDKNARAVAEICDRLDGIPLALELAAASIRMLSPQQIVDRLEDRFALLTSGSRTAIGRHQTLRAAIDWSYELLANKERNLFRRLAVFVGSFGVEAAEKVCSDEQLPEPEILRVLGKLLDKSLLLATEVSSGELRYRMLETIREYGRNQLLAHEDPERMSVAHRLYYLHLVADLAPLLGKEHGQEAVAHLDADLGNLRLALVSASAGDMQAVKWKALGQVLAETGHYDEARRCYLTALELASDQDRVARGSAHAAVAATWGAQRRLPQWWEALDASERALGPPSEKNPPDWWRCWIAIQMSRVGALYFGGKPQQIAELMRQIRPTFEAHATPVERSRLLGQVINHAMLQERYVISNEILRESDRHLEAAAAADDLREVSNARFTRGFIHVARNESLPALDHLAAALKDAHATGSAISELLCNTYMSIAQRRLGRTKEARSLARLALDQATEQGVLMYAAVAEGNLAWVALKEGHHRQAERLGRVAVDRIQEEMSGGYPFKWVMAVPLMAAAMSNGHYEQALVAAGLLLGPKQQPLPPDVADAVAAALAASDQSLQVGVRQDLETVLQRLEERGYA